MDFDQYFKTRTDLTARVLLDSSGVHLEVNRLLLGAGSACIAIAIAVQLWASTTLSDAGYFARTTTFSQFVLLAGTWLLSATLTAAFLLARTSVVSREVTRQKTMRQLIVEDANLARTLVA